MNVRWKRRLGTVLLGVVMAQSGASARELPHFQRNGEATQLIVDGAPYLAFSGELHNSSASSPAYMAPVWDKLARNNVRTVISTASWEQVEPEEGRYDFAAVDDQIRQARARGLRLVMIWFGGYKNAESTYTPSWVRRDEARFPRAQRDPKSKSIAITNFLNGPVISVFGKALAEADARAFAALMKHIKAVDSDQTVIMMQVENEVGLLGDSRDRSRVANTAWEQPVPASLMSYLAAHRADLRPSLLETWGRQGFRRKGSWAEVFGADSAAEEIFMAWGFGRYVETVAKAGIAEHALPMFANAWLGPQPGATLPGTYPSGGPVARMMDVWKAAAPSLALLAPDIYIDDFNGVLADFKRRDNPIFIPEARLDAGNLFVALGQYDAIAFSPFGIEDGADDHAVFQAYRVLGDMTAVITDAQKDGRIRGFKIASGASQKLSIGKYELNLAGPRSMLGAFGPGTGSTEQAKGEGYGLVIQSGDDELLIVGRGISPTFSSLNARVEVDSAQEGTFQNGRWVPGRLLNGDERYSLFPSDSLRTVRIKLLRR
jgi:hypothetical protein